MGLGRGGKCSVFILIFINIPILLLGLGKMVVGILMRTKSSSLKENIISTLNGISLNENIKLGSMVNSLSILIICIGVFCILVASMGVVGACGKNRCLLTVYAIIVLLIFLVQCAAVVLSLTMKIKVENEVKSTLNDAFKKYEGTAATAEVSVGWDLLFIGLDCCGVDAVTSTNEEFNKTAWWKNRGSDEIPVSCCESATQDNYKTKNDNSCTQDLTEHRKKGCYEAIKDWLGKYEVPAICVGVFLLLIEILAAISACKLCKNSRHDSEDDK